MDEQEARKRWEEEERVRNELPYACLTKATLEIDFLSGNSTVHNNPFSAIAELIDNAYDANARKCSIDVVEKQTGTVIEILDDGNGMSQEEVLSIVRFGWSEKKENDQNSEYVGRYGNGYKSGAYYLGTEVLLLTKKGGERTAMLISGKFHQAKGLKAMFVPCPCFTTNMDPYDQTSLEKHDLECEIIEEFAPLGDTEGTVQARLKALFDRIQGPSGTLVVIGGLKRSLMGELEFLLPEHDITLSAEGKEEWQTSLRAYLQVLYMVPKTEIVLRGKTVEPWCPFDGWMGRAYDCYSGKMYRSALEESLNHNKKRLDQAKQKCTMYRSELGARNKDGLYIDSSSRVEDNILRKKYEDASTAVKTLESKEKTLKEDLAKPHKIIHEMGLNVKNRHRYGVSFYLNNRLVLPYFKTMSVYNNKNNLGLSMIVSMTYKEFLPSQNKQHFENKRDFDSLVRKCNSVLIEYLNNYLNKIFIPQHLTNMWKEKPEETDSPHENLSKFWQLYGYANYYSPVSRTTLIYENENVKKKYQEAVGFYKQCGDCRAWRFYRRDKKVFGCQTPCKPALMEGDRKTIQELIQEHKGRGAIELKPLSTHHRPATTTAKATSSQPARRNQTPQASSSAKARQSQAPRATSPDVPRQNPDAQGPSLRKRSAQVKTEPPSAIVLKQEPRTDEYVEMFDSGTEVDRLMAQMRDHQEGPSSSTRPSGDRKSNSDGRVKIERNASKRARRSRDEDELEGGDEEHEDDRAASSSSKKRVSPSTRTPTRYDVLSSPARLEKKKVNEEHQNIMKILNYAASSTSFLKTVKSLLPKKVEDVPQSILSIARKIP